MNFCIKKILFIMLLFLITTTANADEISKEVWLNHMAKALPNVFCQSKQYFRQCFEVIQIECEKIATSATRKCLEEYKEEIPASFDHLKDGSDWGYIVGSCAGVVYENISIKKRINSEKCNNVENWR